MPLGWIAGAAVVGGVLQAGAAESAASQQASSANNAQQIGLGEFNTITQQETPYMQSGYGALSALDYGLGITPQTATGGAPNQPTTSGGPTSLAGLTGVGGIPGLPPGAQLPNATATQGMTTSGQPTTPKPGQTAPGQPLGFGSLDTPFTTQNFKQLSPAYNFQMQQGQQNTLNADASNQGALSGASMKDLISFNQNYANTSFNNAFNQYQTQQNNVFSRLSGLSQLGQNAAANTGQQGTTLAGQQEQAAVAAGSYGAAGTVGAANAISGGANAAAPWLYANTNPPAPSMDPGEGE